MINKIIIAGRACSGKDTIADYLVHNFGFKKISFAEPIYDIANNIFDMEQKDRKLLQSIGEKLREIDPDVWCKAAFKQARQFNKVVISDCRRENEYNYAVMNGFLPIRVNATLLSRIERCRDRDGIEPDTTLWENQSEIGADHCNFIEIGNSGTYDELFTMVSYIVTGNLEYYYGRLNMSMV